MNNLKNIKKVLNWNESKNKIKIENITLSLDEKLHFGRNKLNNIKWFQYKFDEEFHNLYSAVNLMFFKIDEDILKESTKNIIMGGKGVSLLEIPHIDERTGNIHPGKEYVDNFGYNKIEQLVLVNTSSVDPGPKAMDMQEKNDIYSYSKKCIVHKSCYFPRIDNSVPKNDFRYNFLKQVCEKIYEYDKNVLGDDILKAIGK